MKTRLALLAPAALLLGLLVLASCAEPLENPLSTTSGEDPITIIKIDTVVVTDTVIQQDTVVVSDSTGQSDTVIVVDTVVVTDTLVFGDTIIVVDTIVVTDTLVQEDTIVVTDTLVYTDTVVIVDTVIVYLPDTSKTLCARLDSHRKSIVWLLRNDAGFYRLDFSSFVEKDKPPQDLYLRIDGKIYVWRPVDETELTMELDLGPDASIVIWHDQPKACGHAIDICLTITPL